MFRSGSDDSCSCMMPWLIPTAIRSIPRRGQLAAFVAPVPEKMPGLPGAEGGF